MNESGIKERAKDISLKLSDNMGYFSGNNLRWGNRAMASTGHLINFDRVYEYIAGLRRKQKMISAITADGTIMDIFYNHPDPVSHISEEYGFDMEDILLLKEECAKTRVRKEVADNIAMMKMGSGTTCMGRPIDEEIIEFAMFYNDSRIPYGESNVIPPDEMENICSKIDMMLDMVTCKEEEEEVHKDFLRILYEKYGKRKNQMSSKTILYHECAKTMLKYGVVPSENYREWGDQAIAMACMYRSNRKEVMWAIKAMVEKIFMLSHWDEHPLPISEMIVSETEKYAEVIEDASLPVGICVAYEFLKMEHHDRNYLFSILARLSEKCGRKKKKRRRRK